MNRHKIEKYIWLIGLALLLASIVGYAYLEYSYILITPDFIIETLNGNYVGLAKPIVVRQLEWNGDYMIFREINYTADLMIAIYNGNITIKNIDPTNRILEFNVSNPDTLIVLHYYDDYPLVFVDGAIPSESSPDLVKVAIFNTYHVYDNYTIIMKVYGEDVVIKYGNPEQPQAWKGGGWGWFTYIPFITVMFVIGLAWVIEGNRGLIIGFGITTLLALEGLLPAWFIVVTILFSMVLIYLGIKSR